MRILKSLAAYETSRKPPASRSPFPAQYPGFYPLTSPDTIITSILITAYALDICLNFFVRICLAGETVLCSPDFTLLLSSVR